MAIAFLGTPQVQYFNPTTGAFLAGGQLFSYVAGSMTPLATYPSIANAQAQTNANSNPVILDSTGSAQVVLSGNTKLVLQDSLGNQVWAIDNVNEATTNIYDSNGNALLLFNSINSAQNQFTIANAVSGSAPTLSSTGNDSNIAVNVAVKGVANINLNTSSTGTTACQGNLTVAGTSNTTGIATMSTAIATLFQGATAATSYITDSNGVNLINLSATTSAVNSLSVFNAPTTASPGYQVIGSDTNIGIRLLSKGTGGLLASGSTAASYPGAGYIGQVVTSVVPYASRITQATSTVVNITTLSLTAGNWLVVGCIYGNAATNDLGTVEGWSSTTSASVPDVSVVFVGSPSQTTNLGSPIPSALYSFSTTTTVYLSGVCSSTGNNSLCGTITAIRLP